MEAKRKGGRKRRKSKKEREGEKGAEGAYACELAALNNLVGARQLIAVQNRLLCDHHLEIGGVGFTSPIKGARVQRRRQKGNSSTAHSDTQRERETTKSEFSARLRSAPRCDKERHD